ncbi:MAG: UPF0175 family protein [Methylococcaceae bacterium]|nr:MAG: UPF0175 family protein [Methylococcaceae bacterium]
MRRSPTEFVQEMKLAAAMHWYQQGVMSQERAAELAGYNRRDFIHALARRSVDVFIVDEESLARELVLKGKKHVDEQSRRNACCESAWVDVINRVLNLPIC